MIELYILAYCAAVLLGMLVCGFNILTRAFPASPVPESLIWLISLGFCPVLISWLGFAGFFRLPYVTGSAGILFALYALKKSAQLQSTIVNAYRSDRYNFCLLAIIMIALSIPKWCYLYGGINNSDEIRSLALTSGFAANYMKPAYPFNLSIPISYSYYLFQIPAFLYSSISGYSWPSIPIGLTSLVAIAFFYMMFSLYLQALFPKRGAYTLLIGNLCITFFGLDVFVPFDPLTVGQIDSWNRIQVSAMATYHHWVYLYLLSLAFGMGALYAMARYSSTPHPHWIYAGSSCALFSLTFGAITGVWMSIAIAALALIIALFEHKKALTALQSTPAILLLIVFIMLPQIYTFTGRDTLVRWESSPLLWFSRTNMENVSYRTWRFNALVLWKEIGPILTLGLFMALCLVWTAFRRRQWHLIAIVYMAFTTIGITCMTSASVRDWFWRGGNLLLIVFSTIGFLWLYEWLRIRTSVLLLHSAIGLALVPGIINYAMESYFRWRSCVIPHENVVKLNRSTNLHSVFVDEKAFSHRHILMGGRVYYDYIASEFIVTYRNMKSVRRLQFHFPPHQTPCEQTWYGTALPNGIMVNALNAETYKQKRCFEMK